MDPGQRLAQVIEARRQELQSSLERARARFDNSRNKGDDVEVAIRAFLRAHLPRALDVGHGEIIDRFGARGAEADIVLSTMDQPFVVPDGQAGLYFVEAVAAAGEVKSALGSAELDDIERKGRLLRSLEPDSKYLKSEHFSFGHPAIENRFGVSPPFFAFSIESRMSNAGILNRLQSLTLGPRTMKTGAPLPCIDALFLLDANCMFVYTTGENDCFRVNNDSLDGYATGWVQVAGMPALTGLFLWLNMCMIRRTIASPLAPIYMLTDQGS